MGTFSARVMTTRLDALLNANRLADAAEYLCAELAEARKREDWGAELSILSEQIGLYRRTADESLALSAVDTALALIDEHGMAGSIPGATILINAATTISRFGDCERALPIYERARTTYESRLPQGDARLAALYNNMASAHIGLGSFDAAEQLYEKALAALDDSAVSVCDRAVTHANLAELYDLCDPEDARIAQQLDRALELMDSPALPRDGYYAFTCEKIAPAFGRLGFFLARMDLESRAAVIYGQVQP